MNYLRQNLEQTIIGACLLENGYSQVAGILTSRNFTHSGAFNHKAIFEAIERLFPLRPVDLITVVHEVNKSGYASYLAECASKVCSSENLRSHAVILLQICMRDALIQILDNARGAHISSTTLAAIQEIIDHCLDKSEDIFETYQGALSYLESIGAEEFLINDIRKLQNGIDLKVIAIKNQAHIDCLVNNLSYLSKVGTDLNTKLALSRLIELTKGVLVKGNVSSTALDVLNSIEL
jgi:replicative DNA helicase